MGSELSEAREKQLLQAMREVSSEKLGEENGGGAEVGDSRKRKAEEGEEEEGGGKENEEGQGGEKRGVLQAVGELVSQSAHSVKEAVLGKEVWPDSKSQPDNHASNQSPDEKDSAQESLLVHTAVHD